MNFLIKEGIINVKAIIGILIVRKTRRDDQNGAKYHDRDNEGTRVLKFQALIDPNCISLIIILCKENENDRSGFIVLKNKLILTQKNN
ncbi:MAG: hypothetical protein ACTSQO_10385 [Candidatus Helarchaeota archaeon]